MIETTLATSTLASPPAPHPDVAPPAVRVQDLVVNYGERHALDDLSLDVPQGSITGLLGPNGAGKSTLLSVIIGRRGNTSGEIELFGERPHIGLRRRVGVVFQDPSVDPVMTVRETLLLHGRLFGLAGGDTAARANELLSRTGLALRAPDRTRTLSGGLRRRLELARALLPGPDLLVLDEPTLALDPDARSDLWDLLLEANRAGTTLLLATNDVTEAERYCTHVALLDAGRVVAQGAPADLRRGLRRDAVRVEWRNDASQPLHEEVAAWPGVGAVRRAGATWHITTDSASPLLARLFTEHGAAIHAVESQDATLEDVYFQIVGHGIARPTDAP